MALPYNEVSSAPVFAAMLPPDLDAVTALEDHEHGGVAIQDTSAGVSAYRWRCFVDGVTVNAQREGAATVHLFDQAGITEVSFTFDQNMRPAVAYTLHDGSMRLRWYDSLASVYVTDEMGQARNPRLCMDDKRAAMTSSSDILLAYIKPNGEMCYRQQRDRFGVERVLRTGVPANLKLKNVGMTRNMRLLFELV